MDRRKALKISGTALLAPGILSVLTGCRNEPRPEGWKPAILTSAQGVTLGQLADTILPRTTTPSASEVDVPYFIDLLMEKVFSEEQSTRISSVLDQMEAESQNSDSTAFGVLDDHQRYELLDRIDQEAYGLTEAGGFEMEFLEGYKFLKSLILTSYFSSEEGRKQNLEYLPIPGDYIDCTEPSEEQIIVAGDHL